MKNVIIIVRVCLGDRLQNGSPYAIEPLSGLSVCLSCLSVTLVYCDQTVGWIKMKLGTEVGHILLDGDPAPLPKRGTAPNFGPCLLWPNGRMDQDATWYGCRSQPRPHCVLWGAAPRKRAQQPRPPLFGPCLLWPNGRPSRLLLSSCLQISLV